MAGTIEDIDYEVEDLIDTRVTENGITQYLVRWKGFNSEWDSWEPEDNLGSCENLIKKFQNSIEKPKKDVAVRNTKTQRLKVFCSKCEHWFSTEYLYERHFKTDSCRQECLFCGKVFLYHQKDWYKRHLETHTKKNAANTETPVTDKKLKGDYESTVNEADIVRTKIKHLKAMQKKTKSAPIKVIIVKGQRKIKLVGNQKKSTIIDKEPRKISKDKKELITVDDEITFSVLRDNLLKKTAHMTSQSEKEAFVSAHMSEIFEAVLSKSNGEDTSQKLGRDRKKQTSEREEMKKFPVRRTRSVDSKMSLRKFRARTVDKNKSLSTDIKESRATSARSLRVPSKPGDVQKNKKQTQQKVNAAEATVRDKDKKTRSPKSNKSDTHSETVKKKDTSKLDELFNHLMEQVRAATPPTKPSKHTEVSVKNVLKSGKPKVPSPKSSPVKANKAASSQASERKQVAKDLKNKKEKQAKIQIIRVDLPKTSKPVDKKEKEKTKTAKEKTTKTVKEHSKRKPVKGHKRKASGDVIIETDDESNSDDGFLYSLSDMEDNDSTPTQSPEDSGKQKSASTTTSVVEKDVTDVIKTKNNKKVGKVVKSQSESGVEKSQQPKKMRLLDSLTKPAVVKPVRPVSPTPLFTAVKTAAVVPTTSNSRKNSRAPGGIPMYQYVIQPSAAIPVSPTSMSYKMLLENLPHQLHPKKNKNKSENGEEDVERRISVRASECAFKYKEIIVKKCQKYTQIWLYTHTKMKNSLNPQVILELQSALNAAKYDDSNLVMLSGLDNVFCSGIDLHFLQSGDKKVAARQMVDALRDFTKTLITFPKLIVAVVTGPAIGLGMTILPLCDVVYASDKATFFLPYAQLAQTPEGCASYTLPQALGMAMANELLIGGRKITAIEACQLGLVSQVYWPTSMMQEVIPRIQNMAQSSGKVLETTKLLIRSHQRTKLDLTNESEINLLLECWTSTECQRAITEFLDDEKNYTF